MNFKDKTIVITGGSRGLGRALAFEFGILGARIAIVARGTEDLESTLADLHKHGYEATAVIADVGDKRDIHRVVGQIGAKLGTPDLLVHNASTLGPTPLRPLLDTDCEDLQRVLEVNTVGPFRLSKAFAGAMALRGSGTILHISSDAAVDSYPNWGAYSISKAASDHLSRLFATELAATGVRVIAIDPGEMDTEMHARAIPEADPKQLARPQRVAKKIVRALQRDALNSGERVSAAHLEEAA